MCENYESFLTKSGLTEKMVLDLMDSLPSPVNNEIVNESFRRGPSEIQGVGMFADRAISKGETFPVCQKSVRFDLARYVNHSGQPNSLLYFDDQQNGRMETLRNIGKSEEITFDYEDNMKKSLAESGKL